MLTVLILLIKAFDQVFKNRFDQLMKEVHQPKFLIIKDEAGLDFKNQKINPVFHKML